MNLPQARFEPGSKRPQSLNEVVAGVCPEEAELRIPRAGRCPLVHTLLPFWRAQYNSHTPLPTFLHGIPSRPLCLEGPLVRNLPMETSSEAPSAGPGPRRWWAYVSASPTHPCCLPGPDPWSQTYPNEGRKRKYSLQDL